MLKISEKGQLFANRTADHFLLKNRCQFPDFYLTGFPYIPSLSSLIRAPIELYKGPHTPSQWTRYFFCISTHKNTLDFTLLLWSSLSSLNKETIWKIEKIPNFPLFCLLASSLWSFTSLIDLQDLGFTAEDSWWASSLNQILFLFGYLSVFLFN